MITSLNNIFDDLWTGNFNRNFKDSERLPFKPAVNIIENDKAYLLQFQIPGIPKDAIKIDVEDKILTVSYEHSEETKEETEKTLRTEFAQRSFKRSFNLGKTIEVESITAQFDLGILTLNLPKREAEKNIKKSISIA